MKEAQLVSVHSPEQDWFLKELSRGEEYWLGGYYLGDPEYISEYFWSDLSDWDYEHFSSAGQGCVYQSFTVGEEIR